MSKKVDATLRYWRASLADGTLGTGKFRQKDISKLNQISSETLNTGQLPKRITEQLFKSQPDAHSISVRFWPYVMAKTISHGAVISNSLPDFVAPIVTEATINREGRLTASRNTIARDLLTPMKSDDFAIGTVDALDDFLTKQPLKSNPDWRVYKAHCAQMMDVVANGWPKGDSYLPTDFCLLEPAEKALATVRSTLDLYDKVLTSSRNSPLLNNLISPSSGSINDANVETALARRLGHANPNFPLAVQQRQVLAWLDAASPGDVVAVNGPPGTGKTTLLLSAVAGLWVRAALDGGDPPVIVAASSNNQAVTNIIDAFGKDFASGDGPLAGRWLPGIESFGMFLPASSKRKNAGEKYQTEDFQAGLETVEGFQAAKEAWLCSAVAAFPDVMGDVADYVAAIRKAIIVEVAKLEEADRSLERLNRALERARVLGDNPKIIEAGARAKADEQAGAFETWKRHRAAFDHQQANESSILALFNFLPAIARKRLLRARAALDGLAGLEELKSVSELDDYLSKSLKDAQSAHLSADKVLESIRLRTH